MQRDALVRADTAAAGPRNPRTALTSDPKELACAISQPDIANPKDSLKQDEQVPDMPQRKKKRTRNKHHVIHISGHNIESVRSNDRISARNRPSESQIDQKPLKMMVVQKNHTYVAMVHMNENSKFSNDGRS